ncbi:MAG: bifunctional 5,10-methylenetetrahydrofolate dehydrogenase/5,10-methenyltetrahydrofolate cyclohydrolase [Oscillospiraceae bacterium]|jgi:methylenetetrahydrofolate dehydrogenase (NADP+)/methenyltetrahydrofolate cyclohydrolase|nr:bifunctional 5,10-methylenetetrahydrofolate dehydrogenase/5,10-methenyltetrahydrofolate cyclohydrolase [Oscillospiraceae bacterium]
MAILMDGKAAAKTIKAEVLERAQRLRERGIEPSLAVILVGDDPASAVYVRNKEKDCEECGIKGIVCRLPAETTQDELLVQIARLDANPAVHGILIQQPLPAGIDPFVATYAVDPCKDVDALHPQNAGLISLDRPHFLPCTPAGIMVLLDLYGIDPRGKHAVIIGRSHIVGKPMTQLLLSRDATVTVCHSRTPDLGAVTRTADILVSAVGRIGLVTGDMIKPGAAVIDVGINRKPDGKLAGDVVFAEAEPVASYITPVPGGVGPMTRAILMKNTITAAVEATV